MTLPYKFQLADVRRVEKMRGKSLIAWDPGCGKTFLSLYFLHRNPDALPAVVVCPAPLKLQWQRESAHHFGVRAEVLQGVNPVPFGMAGAPQVLIVNYEILHPCSRDGKLIGPGWLEALKKLAPRTVVIDECAALKDSSAKQTRAVKSLCQGVPNILALSATPIEIRPMELYPVLNLLRPKQFSNKPAFGHAYCGAKKNYFSGGWDFNGASNLDKLHKELQTVMIRRRKADVIKDLPRKIRTVVPLELSDRKQYDLAATDFFKWLSSAAPGKLKGAVKAAGLARASHLKRLAADLKLPAAGAWIDTWLKGSGGKILLFAVHKKIVAWLHERYKGRCVVVDGSVTGRKRQNAVDLFQKDPRYDVFIGNIEAAGKGLNLTAAVATAFLEYPWAPSDLLQAEDRCYARLSDVHGSQSFYLVAQNTIEERIIKLLQSRSSTMAAVLDGGKVSDLNIFDLLIKSLREET